MVTKIKIEITTSDTHAKKRKAPAEPSSGDNNDNSTNDNSNTSIIHGTGNNGGNKKGRANKNDNRIPNSSSVTKVEDAQQNHNQNNNSEETGNGAGNEVGNVGGNRGGNGSGIGGAKAGARGSTKGDGNRGTKAGANGGAMAEAMEGAKGGKRGGAKQGAKVVGEGRGNVGPKEGGRGCRKETRKGEGTSNRDAKKAGNQVQPDNTDGEYSVKETSPTTRPQRKCNTKKNYKETDDIDWESAFPETIDRPKTKTTSNKHPSNRQKKSNRRSKRSKDSSHGHEKAPNHIEKKFYDDFPKSDNVKSLEMQRKYILETEYSRFREDIKFYHENKDTKSTGSLAMIKHRLLTDYLVKGDRVFKLKEKTGKYVQVVTYQELCGILYCACSNSNHDRIKMRNYVNERYDIRLGVCDWYRQNICEVCTNKKMIGSNSTKANQSGRKRLSSTPFDQWIKYRNKISLVSKLNANANAIEESQQHDDCLSLFSEDLAKSIQAKCNVTLSETALNNIVRYLSSKYTIILKSKPSTEM